MAKTKNNISLILLLLGISLVFISALIIEYVLGFQACKLCVYERIPYIISIFSISTILLLKKYEKIILFFLFLVFIFSVALSFYHFGIEQGFFNELSVCGDAKDLETLSKEQLLERIKQNDISCKNVSFRIAGLSLAAINTILSTILSGIFIKLYLNYEKN
ncbi:MAG: disulfide bond formation protein DsbB [Pelagibacterales bacterium]|jgi:disulfide bond formation protein DsbB|nr:disulfide bond formation protein DsbB [Pelagibacterales bacterium]